MFLIQGMLRNLTEVIIQLFLGSLVLQQQKHKLGEREHEFIITFVYTTLSDEFV